MESYILFMSRKLDSTPFLQEGSSLESEFSYPDQQENEGYEDHFMLSKNTEDIDFEMADDFDDDSIPEENTPC